MQSIVRALGINQVRSKVDAVVDSLQHTSGGSRKEHNTLSTKGARGWIYLNLPFCTPLPPRILGGKIKRGAAFRGVDLGSL